MQVSELQWNPPDGSEAIPAISLEQDRARLILLPDRGGKIVSFADHTHQKEWLWLNSSLPWKTPFATDSYTAEHDLGGWDECFPTVAPTTVGGISWPDHGDLWWRPWQSEARQGKLWMRVNTELYDFERRIEPQDDGFRFAYQVTNQSDAPLPYLWCAHPLFSLDPPLELEIFDRPRVLLGNDSVLGKSGDVHRWPNVQGRMLDKVGKPSGIAAKLFLEMDRGEATLCDSDGATLQLRWPLNRVPLLGLWINEGGWSGADVSPYCNLGVEPATGAPDDLAIALNEWESASILQPGESHKWWLQVQVGTQKM